jgi:CRP-like cAMP-binding protein
VEASTRNATFIPAESGPDRPGGIASLDIKVPSLTANRLLAGLPHDDLKLLESQSTPAPRKQRALLFDVGDEVEHVTFPLGGMVSLLVVLNNGDAVETATVGREGVVGAMAGLGLHTSRVRAVIQLPGVFARISATQFRRAVTGSKALSEMCIRYNEALLAQARTTAACNLSHGIEARFCRWLLQSREECRRNRAFHDWKHRMWASGCRLPTQETSGRSRCFCGVDIEAATMDRHISTAHMAG